MNYFILNTQNSNKFLLSFLPAKNHIDSKHVKAKK